MKAKPFQRFTRMNCDKKCVIDGRFSPWSGWSRAKYPFSCWDESTNARTPPVLLKPAHKGCPHHPTLLIFPFVTALAKFHLKAWLKPVPAEWRRSVVHAI